MATVKIWFEIHKEIYCDLMVEGTSNSDYKIFSERYTLTQAINLFEYHERENKDEDDYEYEYVEISNSFNTEEEAMIKFEQMSNLNQNKSPISKDEIYTIVKRIKFS